MYNIMSSELIQNSSSSQQISLNQSIRDEISSSTKIGSSYHSNSLIENITQQDDQIQNNKKSKEITPKEQLYPTQKLKKIKKMKYGLKLYQTVEIKDVFLIEGELLFYPKAFMSYNQQNNLESVSPMNTYRPIRKINLNEGQWLDIELDNLVDTAGNLQMIIQFLNRINDQNSQQLKTYITFYEHLIKDQQETLKLVFDHYSNKQQELITKLEINFQSSLQQAQKYVEQLNKQNIICSYFIRRVNYKNLFKKTHSMGATKMLLDVCCGPTAENKQYLMEKLLREGVPNFLDYRGYVQYLLQSFSGCETETIDLITFDQFKIPCRIKSFMQPLSSVEIIPGSSVYDELTYTIYTPTNDKIVQSLQNQRKQSQQQLSHTNYDFFEINDFTYEAKSEQFIQKYYPDSTYQLKYKRKKPENFKKPNPQQLQQQIQNQINDIQDIQIK